jgi:hypothetical protein
MPHGIFAPVEELVNSQANKHQLPFVIRAAIQLPLAVTTKSQTVAIVYWSLAKCRKQVAIGAGKCCCPTGSTHPVTRKGTIANRFLCLLRFNPILLLKA